jgi:predicted Zn-ribbon and HTH transcriptional regulator
MFRNDVIGILRARAISLRAPALLLDKRPHDLAGHLEQLLRSSRNGPPASAINPAACRRCGFLLDENKLQKRGECPGFRGPASAMPPTSAEERR